MTDSSTMGISQVDMRTVLGEALINPQLHFVAGVLTANAVGVSNDTAYIFIGIIIISHAFVFWVNND